LAREHVTVALTGDGGDELFAGYLRYQAVRWSGRVDRFPGPLRAFVQADYWRRRASRGSQRSFLRRLARFTEGLAERPERRYAEWISIFNLTRRASLYTEEFMSRLGNADPGEFLDAAFRRAAGRDSVTAAGLADLTTYLPCDLLTKVDIASMAHGLECRQPFLDHHVVELAASLPLGMKLRRGDTKWILKHAFADLLPPQIARRKKQGFGVPLARWFRGELRELLTSTLLDERALARGYFQLASLERLIAEHQSGAWDHSHRLWALLFLELWHQRWVD
jgi:asparagine synthase (glutamine-hydrolysing)